MAGVGPCTAALAAVVRDVGDVAVVAGTICRAFVEGLDMDGAALTLLTATTAGHTLHATDEVAAWLEELQFSLNEGASIEAAGTGRPVLVADLVDGAQSSRWPVFAAAATEEPGVRAIVALPLRWGSARLGVVSVYRRRPGGMTDEQRVDLRAAVDLASLMILTARTGAKPLLAHRAEVHQATGMMVAQLGVDPEDALARMRAHAFAEQRLLVEVAHDVVSRVLVFADDLNAGHETEEAP